MQTRPIRAAPPSTHPFAAHGPCGWCTHQRFGAATGAGAMGRREAPWEGGENLGICHGIPDNTGNRGFTIKNRRFFVFSGTSCGNIYIYTYIYIYIYYSYGLVYMYKLVCHGTRAMSKSRYHLKRLNFWGSMFNLMGIRWIWYFLRGWTLYNVY